MFATLIIALAQATAAPAAATAPAPTPAAAVSPASDYTLDQNWLCRPGREDLCAVNLDVTVVDADGKTTAAPFAKPKATPAVDCFYVYPTVSTDPGLVSDMTPDAAEKSVIAAQFARFQSVCRTFAPQYRQVTMSGLRQMMEGRPLTGDLTVGYRDVVAAFKDYMARDNGGRPFVLIGHSQGSNVLQRLVQNEIDGKPLQAKMLSAMLIGFNTEAPKGKDVGGTFKSVPVCTSTTQLGCVISYVSFRADAPPPPASRFGRATTPGMEVICSNPAKLGSKDNVGLNAVMGTAAGVGGWAKGATVGTPYVSPPGFLSGQCVTAADGASYLAVTTNADPADPRTDAFFGDVVIGGQIQKDWGLHLVDMPVAMGDLVALVKTQGEAYLAKK